MKTTVALAVLFCVAFAEAVEEAPQDELGAEAACVSKEAAPAGACSCLCPEGWVFHRSRCYLFVKTLTSWYNAEEHCNSLGAQLASATSPSEYSFLQQLTKTGVGDESFSWMGGFYLQDRWLWIDREGFYYSNWDPLTNPNSSYSCIYLYTSGGWTNASCNARFYYICSKTPSGC